MIFNVGDTWTHQNGQQIEILRIMKVNLIVKKLNGPDKGQTRTIAKNLVNGIHKVWWKDGIRKN